MLVIVVPVAPVVFPVIVATVTVVTVTVVVVVAAVAVTSGAVNDAVQLATVQPDSPALRAVVDFPGEAATTAGADHPLRLRS